MTDMDKALPIIAANVVVRSRIREIRGLELAGILSRELCPTPKYWHWDVLRPADLPASMRADYQQFGEIRWYGH